MNLFIKYGCYFSEEHITDGCTYLFTDVVNCCFQFSLLEQKSKNQNVDIAWDNTGKVSYFSIFRHCLVSQFKLSWESMHHTQQQNYALRFLLQPIICQTQYDR